MGEHYGHLSSPRRASRSGASSPCPTPMASASSRAFRCKRN